MKTIEGCGKSIRSGQIKESFDRIARMKKEYEDYLKQLKVAKLQAKTNISLFMEVNQEIKTVEEKYNHILKLERQFIKALALPIIIELDYDAETIQFGDKIGNVLDNSKLRNATGIIYHHQDGFEIRTPTPNYPNDLKGDELIGIYKTHQEIAEGVFEYYKRFDRHE